MFPAHSMLSPVKHFIFNKGRIPTLLCWLIFIGWVFLHLIQYEKLRCEYYFRMDLSIPESGNFKVFYSQDGVFTEENSIVVHMSGTDHLSNAIVRLPVNEFSYLRIDPTDNTSSFRFGNMQIVNEMEETLLSFPVEQLSAANAETCYSVEDGIVASETPNRTSDPSFVLAPDPAVVLPVFSLDAAIQNVVKSYAFPFLAVFLLILMGGWTYGVYGGIVFFFWMVFDPGFYSPDSIDQIIQAKQGVYWNQHPPVMALMLRWWFAVTGLGIREWIFAQGLMGIFGVRLLLKQSLQSCVKGYILSPLRLELVSLVGIVLLMSIMSPLRFYLNTLWKDSWAAIEFIWLFGGLFFAYNRRIRDQAVPWYTVFGVGLLMLLIILTRYNAIVIAPVFALILGVLLFPRIHWMSILLAGVFLVGLVGAKPFLHQSLKVREFPIENQMLTLDLVGFYLKYPELRKELPYTGSSLKNGWEEKFEWASIYPISFTRPLIVTEEYGSYTRENPKLKEEYLRVFKTHPFRMLMVKSTHFVQLFGWESTHYWYHGGIEKNELGLKPNTLFKNERKEMLRAANKISTSVWRWVSGVHLVWILVNLVFLGWMLIVWLNERTELKLLWVMFLMIPLMYYASYLISAPAKDFRYMYPSTLTLQTIGIAWIASRLMKLPIFTASSGKNQ